MSRFILTDQTEEEWAQAFALYQSFDFVRMHYNKENAIIANQRTLYFLKKNIMRDSKDRISVIESWYEYGRLKKIR